jgi:hypothetical protein
MTVAKGYPPRREHRVATAKAMDFPSGYGDLVLALKGITDTVFSLFGYQRARMLHSVSFESRLDCARVYQERSTGPQRNELSQAQRDALPIRLSWQRPRFRVAKANPTDKKAIGAHRQFSAKNSILLVYRSRFSHEGRLFHISLSSSKFSSTYNRSSWSDVSARSTAHSLGPEG